MLKRFHCQVVDVVNGAEGVQQIQENGPFHVVFMDIHMPVMDGFAATRAIRALPPPLCDIPIVAITAYTTRDDSDRYLEAVCPLVQCVRFKGSSFGAVCFSAWQSHYLSLLPLPYCRA